MDRLRSPRRARLLGTLVSAVLVVSLVILVQLWQTPSGTGVTSTPAPTESPVGSVTPGVAGSRVKAYHSVAELTADASLIVLARATSTSTVERIQFVPFTVTTMDAVEAWKGTLSSTQLKLRQTGEVGAVSSDGPLVRSGQTYLLFLDRFTFGPGRETDQFVVLGVAAGLFIVDGARVTRLDPLSPDIPASMELAQLHAQVALTLPPTMHENAVLGYRITLPDTYRRSASRIFMGQPILGRDTYTFRSEADERADCQADAGDIPSPASAAYLDVEVYRNVPAISAVEWATTPRAPGAQPLSTHQRVEPLTIGGLDAVRLVQDQAIGCTTRYVIRANDRMYVLGPHTWPTPVPLDTIAPTFTATAPAPFPTPTAASQTPREAAGALRQGLVTAFAARDAQAVVALMTTCWIGVIAQIDPPLGGSGGLNRSVPLFMQGLRDRFAKADLTVVLEPDVQLRVEGGRDRYFVRSEWREPDRATRIDLFLDEIDGRWQWSGAVHYYRRADLVNGSCIPYRQPWASGSC